MIRIRVREYEIRLSNNILISSNKIRINVIELMYLEVRRRDRVDERWVGLEITGFCKTCCTSVGNTLGRLGASISNTLGGLGASIGNTLGRLGASMGNTLGRLEASMGNTTLGVHLSINGRTRSTMGSLV